MFEKKLKALDYCKVMNTEKLLDEIRKTVYNIDEKVSKPIHRRSFSLSPFALSKSSFQLNKSLKSILTEIIKLSEENRVETLQNIQLSKISSEAQIAQATKQQHTNGITSS